MGRRLGCVRGRMAATLVFGKVLWLSYEVSPGGHLCDNVEPSELKWQGYENLSLTSAMIHLDGFTGW